MDFVAVSAYGSAVSTDIVVAKRFYSPLPTSSPPQQKYFGV